MEGTDFSNHDICEQKDLFRCPVRIKNGILLRESDIISFGKYTLTEKVHCINGINNTE